MLIWVILQLCCDEFHSAWKTEELANEQCELLNKELEDDDAEPNYYVRRKTLNG